MATSASSVRTSGPRNTRDELLQTIVPNNTVPFVCPACGRQMNLRTPGTFELNLTPRFRKAYNEVLACYTEFLDRVEQELAARNLPGSMRPSGAPYAYAGQDDLPTDKVRDGLYDTEAARQMGSYWWRRFDRYNFAHGIQEELSPLSGLRSLLDAGANAAGPDVGVGLPRRSAQAGGRRPESPFDVLIRVVVTALEPWRLAGHLMSTVFDQPHVRRLLRHVDPLAAGEAADPGQPGEGHKLFLDLTREPGIAPTLAKYLDLAEKVVSDDALAAQFLCTDNAAQRETLRSMIHRARLTLVLLLGHRAKAAVAAYPGLYRLNVPFALSHRIVVTPRHLRLLLTAVPRDIPAGEGLPESFWALLEGAEPIPEVPGADDESPEQMTAAVTAMAKRLGPFTHLVFRFVCCGPSGRPPATMNASALEDKKPVAELEYAPEDPDYCGWYPKEQATHPVVFIGSPGTSKSTLMRNGMVAFYDNVQALRATVRFRSDRDLRNYVRYIDWYWNGEVAAPTDDGTRDSVHLRVEATDDPRHGAEFVFTDIPGEMVSRSVLGEGADPYVLSVLQYAETIVFLFDLSIEPAVQQKLRSLPDHAGWETLIGNYDQVLKDRSENRDAGEAERNVRIVQFELLEKMIGDLTEIRDELGRDGGPNFVCVIPKADLYAADGLDDDEQRDIRFLSGFFDYLQDSGVLSPAADGARNLDMSSLAWFSSAAGYGAKLADGTAMPKDRGMGKAIIDWQLELAAEISEKAKEYLAKIGDALGPDADGAKRDALGDMLRWRLIERLQSVFGEDRVYFLPVSAQGADLQVDQTNEHVAESTTGEEEPRRIGHPPNGKLAEYAFILPVLLALRAKSTELPGLATRRTGAT